MSRVVNVIDSLVGIITVTTIDKDRVMLYRRTEHCESIMDEQGPNCATKTELSHNTFWQRCSVISPQIDATYFLRLWEIVAGNLHRPNHPPPRWASAGQILWHGRALVGAGRRLGRRHHIWVGFDGS